MIRGEPPRSCKTRQLAVQIRCPRTYADGTNGGIFTGGRDPFGHRQANLATQHANLATITPNLATERSNLAMQLTHAAHGQSGGLGQILERRRTDAGASVDSHWSVRRSRAEQSVIPIGSSADHDWSVRGCILVRVACGSRRNAAPGSRAPSERLAATARSVQWRPRRSAATHAALRGRARRDSGRRARAVVRR